MGQGQARGQDGGFSFLFGRFFFLFGDVSFFVFSCQPHSSPHPPLPRSLIGSDIILFNSALLWVASGEGGGARGKGHAQVTVGHAVFCFFSYEGVGSLGGAHCLALLPQPHSRRSALLGPGPIEALALCRIFPEGLFSSVGLLSRVWRGVLGVFGVPPPPPPFFCERLFADL